MVVITVITFQAKILWSSIYHRSLACVLLLQFLTDPAKILPVIFWHDLTVCIFFCHYPYFFAFWTVSFRMSITIQVFWQWAIVCLTPLTVFRNRFKILLAFLTCIRFCRKFSDYYRFYLYCYIFLHSERSFSGPNTVKVYSWWTKLQTVFRDRFQTVWSFVHKLYTLTVFGVWNCAYCLAKAHYELNTIFQFQIHSERADNVYHLYVTTHRGLYHFF